MLKKVKIVIGSMYGDEGKGFTTDYLCETFCKQPVLNVKFNGTAQAGHTVTRNNKKHIFKTFGAGMMLNNVYTLLSSDFVVEPTMFNIEANNLSNIFNCNKSEMFKYVYVDKKCEIILPWDRLMNEKVERERMKKGENHGSCGYGLYESILRSKNYKSITVGELYALTYDELFEKIKEFQNCEYYNSKLDNVYGDELVYNFMEDLINIFMYCNIVDEQIILQSFDNIIFEGAQGLMLDWDRQEFMPNLTASKTNSNNVIKLLNNLNCECDVEVVYITRSYHTRHGKGYMLHEVNKSSCLGFYLFDETNQPNEFQETLRYGYFDYNNFECNINSDFNLLLNSLNHTNIVKSVMLTHSKLTGDKVLFPDTPLTIKEFNTLLKSQNVNKLYIGNLDKVYVIEN